MEAFHGEERPLNGVVGLVAHCTHRRHLRVGEHCIPAHFLVLEPVPDALPVGCASRGRAVGDKMAEPLTQRHHPQVLTLPYTVPEGVKLALSQSCFFEREEVYNSLNL